MLFVRDTLKNVGVELKRIRHVFVHANARRLLYVRLFGQAGDGLLQTALATFVLFSPQREADPKRIALSFAILLIPYSVVGPFVGVFIDRWPRRQILIFANSLRVFTMIMIAFIITQHSANAYLAIFVLVSLGINRFVQAALAASLPHVIGNDELITANSLFPTLGTTAASVAAASGLAIQHIYGNTDTSNAVLVLIGAVGAGTAVFVATTIRQRFALGPSHDEVNGEDIRNVFYGLTQGIKRVRLSSLVQVSMSAVLLQRFVFGAITVNTLIYSRTLWYAPSDANASVTAFGLCAGAAATGAFAAAMLSALVLSGHSHIDGRDTKRPLKLIRVIVLSGFISTIAVIGAASARTLLATLIAAATLGFIGQVLKINADTNIQQEIDDEHRGRVFSLFDMGINFSLVLGIFAFALTCDLRTNAWLDACFMAAPLVAVMGLTLAQYRKAMIPR